MLNLQFSDGETLLLLLIYHVPHCSGALATTSPGQETTTRPRSEIAKCSRTVVVDALGKKNNIYSGTVSVALSSRQVYKKKTEAAKKEYLKALAAYRASLVSKVSAKGRRTRRDLELNTQFFPQGSDTSESPAPIYASSPAHPATGQMQSPPAPPPQHSHSPGQPVQGQQQQQQQQQPQHQFRGE